MALRQNWTRKMVGFRGRGRLSQLFSISFAFELHVFVEVLIPIMSRWFIYWRFCDNFGSFRETVALWISHIRWKFYFRFMSLFSFFYLIFQSALGKEKEKEKQAYVWREDEKIQNRMEISSQCCAICFLSHGNHIFKSI